MIGEGGSRTVGRPALLRAAHQVLDDEPRILADPWAVGLVAGTSRTEIVSQAESLQSPGMKLLRSAMVLRSRYAEDRLAAAMSEGVDQYVLLGAGLDTFAFRQPAGPPQFRVFELDHPCTQASKASLLRARRMRPPTNVSYVASDFTCQSPGPPLLAAGFDPRKPAFFSWLGVTQYLADQAIDGVLCYVAGLPSRSGVAFSFNPPEDELDGLDLEEARGAAIRTASLGEPWLSRPTADSLLRRLHALGFRDIEHLDPDSGARIYFKERRDGLRAPRFEQLMSAFR